MDEQNDLKAHLIMWHLLTYLPIIMSVIIIITISCHKRKKIKEDVFTIYKLILSLVFNMFIWIYTLTSLIVIHLTPETHSFIKEWNIFFEKISVKLFVPYFFALVFSTILVSYESYKSIRDPSYTLISYISKKVWNLKYEILILILLVITIYFEFFLEKLPLPSNPEFLLTDNDKYMYFYVIIFLMTVFSFIFYFLKREMLCSYLVNSKYKAEKKNQADLLQSVILFLIAFYALIVAGIKYFFDSSEKDFSGYDEVFTNLRLIFNYIFMIAVFLDLLLIMYSIYASDFYYYTLGNKKIGRIYRIFGKKYFKKPKLDFSGSTNTSKESSVVFLQKNLNYMMDEFSIETLDNMINISLASIYKILSNLKKPVKKEVSNNLSLDLNLKIGEENLIEFSNSLNLEKNKNLIVKDAIANENIQDMDDNQYDEDFKIYEFQKYEFSEDHLLKLISFNPNQNSSVSDKTLDLSNINVIVKSFMDQKFCEVFKAKNKLDPEVLLQSLLSNLNPNMEGWNSLINKNIKEEFFRKQNKLILSTYDGLFNLEICDEDTIFSDDNKICDMSLRYLDYMKSHNLSFLPIILGIYKIKINAFKEITLILTKNNIVEETPKEYFNYWQLNRFNNNQSFEMITSSKDRNSNMIKDETLFTEDLVLTLNDYNNFRKILMDDMNLLNQMKSNHFGILINYYEIGANLNTSNATSSQEVTPFANPRISLENLVGGFRVSVISKTNHSIFPKANIERTSQMKFSNKENESLSLLEDIKIIIFKEKVGFEANYNNFRCILFFEFENPFHYTQRFCLLGYYKDFLKNFFVHFEPVQEFD